MLDYYLKNFIKQKKNDHSEPLGYLILELKETKNKLIQYSKINRTENLGN